MEKLNPVQNSIPPQLGFDDASTHVPSVDTSYPSTH